jgi:23S rRNA (pseudouridine1915-N3)-methyltransferase
MRFIVAAVGKPRHQGMAAAIQDYEARAARYWPLNVCEVREESARGAAPELVREREGVRILGCAGAGARIVACEAEGDVMTSLEFADWVRQSRERATHDVVFVLGGAFGLSADVRARAAVRLSFSRWTLPHELARLVLAEQLYRAGTIIRGEPYHK